MKGIRFVVSILLIAAVLVIGSLVDTNAHAAPLNDPKTPTLTRVFSPTPNAALMAQITLVFAQATDTQIAIAKTEQALQEAQMTQVEYQRLQSIDMTNQAYQYMLINTQNALATQSAQTIVATHTSGAETAQATRTSGNATAWANVTATQLAATQQIERDTINVKRATIWGMFLLSMILGLMLLMFLGVKVWRMWKLSVAEYIQASKLEPDMHGRMPVTNADALGKGNKLINPNLQHRSVLDPQQDDLSTEQALVNSQAQRQLEATRAIAASPAFVKLAARQAHQDEKPVGDVQISKPAVPLLSHPGLAPSWSMIQDWDGKGGIPYGVSGNGLELVDLQHVPHGGVFGKTGMGKSRYFLRTFIAGALAAGHRVVILGKQADFWPFANHPNVTMVPVRHITQIDEAERYAGYLRRIVEEMNRRDEYMTSMHVSTWDRAGRENTLVVLDELGNAMDMMPDAVRKDAMRWVQGLAKEGRKAGFNMWMATQRAVGFKSIVEQLGRAVFYLADAEASRIALGVPGAEELSDGQFFVNFRRLKRCVAFDPTDDELSKFLQSRAVKAHEPVDWIEGKITTDSTQPNESSVEDRIRSVLANMKARGDVSLSQAQRVVWGEDDPRGGKHFKQIQEIWVQMQAEAATATGNKAPTADLSGSATGIA